ncbi:hypothetical protein TNCV_4523091 [Trichonephila clavipes]|nr:hypothetical protein TNCV_4523091 [Trichonephila clavipes]
MTFPESHKTHKDTSAVHPATKPRRTRNDAGVYKEPMHCLSKKKTTNHRPEICRLRRFDARGGQRVIRIVRHDQRALVVNITSSYNNGNPYDMSRSIAHYTPLCVGLRCRCKNHIPALTSVIAHIMILGASLNGNSTLSGCCRFQQDNVHCLKGKIIRERLEEHSSDLSHVLAFEFTLHESNWTFTVPHRIPKRIRAACLPLRNVWEIQEQVVQVPDTLDYFIAPRRLLNLYVNQMGSIHLCG